MKTTDLNPTEQEREMAELARGSLCETQLEWAAEPGFEEGSQKVYLDHNATSPVAPWVRKSVSEWLLNWGNPSSIHWAGRGPKAVLREARQNIAKLLGVSPLELIFTAGGSESNNLAIKGVLNRIDLSRGSRLITSKVEHPSVAEIFKRFEADGVDVQYVRISREGELDLDHFKSLLHENTKLVSVMLANNETGMILPIKKMAKAAHQVGALFHTDAVQALGKIPVDLSAMGVDLASFSGHKFYALKGSGVLFCRRGVELDRQIDGGGQERHRRAGTENLLAIRSFSMMAEKSDLVLEMGEQMRKLRDHLQSRVVSEIEGVIVNGGEKRLPNSLSVSIQGVDGESLLMNLDMKGFAVSTGAACSSGSPEPSATLLAIGLSFEEAQSSLRLSLGWGTQLAHVDRFVEALKDVVERLREIAKENLH